MILCDRCSTSYDLAASLFRGRRSTLDRRTLDRWSEETAKRIGTRPSALHSTFNFRRKSRRIASFLTLSKLRALRRSRRIASCSSLQITPHCITLCYPTPHHTTLRYATLRYATHTHYTTLLLQLQIQIYYALLRYITLHYLHTNYTIYTNYSTRR